MGLKIRDANFFKFHSWKAISAGLYKTGESKHSELKSLHSACMILITSRTLVFKWGCIDTETTRPSKIEAVLFKIQQYSKTNLHQC